MNDGDFDYGFARVPENDKPVHYGRFRNLYLYITEVCDLHCKHCYLGDRLKNPKTMPFEQVQTYLTLWKKMGSRKLSFLGGEPTLHKDFKKIVAFANKLNYEKIILNTNGYITSRKILEQFSNKDFSYIQVSLESINEDQNDQIRGKDTTRKIIETIRFLCRQGFDTRIICTVNALNIKDALQILPFAEDAGVNLVKFHYFSEIGNGKTNNQLGISPREWIKFCNQLEQTKKSYQSQIWYQPTYATKLKMEQYIKEGYGGCLGKALDRISVFPDKRAYICSYLFDTDLHFATIEDDHIKLNANENEFNLFTKTLSIGLCDECLAGEIFPGCPAEELITGCKYHKDNEKIYPVCRLWKSDVD